jgi:glycosyltransferase involved in cell wall biosynthesis
MTPKISILVPVYNVAPYIERCVHSLLGQTKQDLEFVFVDDASTDRSRTILESVLMNYPLRRSQIRIIAHTENKGIGIVRQTLLNAATGDYLLWVDSDDYLIPEATELLFQAAVSENADIVTTDSYYSHRSVHNITVICQQFPTDPRQYIEKLAFRQVRAALWGTISRRVLWTGNRICFADGINFGEDYYTTVRLFYFAEKIAVLHQPVYYYNQANVGSYSSGVKQELHFESMIRLFVLLEDFFEQQHDAGCYRMFLDKARLMERSAYLLHTTPVLRRKYAALFSREAAEFHEIALPLSEWQRFLLKLITARHHRMADVAILLAKVLRRYLHIPF